jgi:dTDP-4-dehydrorhamnose reductase
MLGHTLIEVFKALPSLEVFGTIRSDIGVEHSKILPSQKLFSNFDISEDATVKALNKFNPDVVINCIGLVKQLAESKSSEKNILVNSLFPHQLARNCEKVGSRLIHFSTDCVFSGIKGSYLESDVPDARDLYGLSKLLGEVDYANSLTIRTSIIGHELSTKHGLVEWFLSQSNTVNGYSNAYFSGLTTREVGNVLGNFILPQPTLSGIFHLSSSSISKFKLLQLINETYNKNIRINLDDSLKIDRSLNSKKLKALIGYISPSWESMIAEMRKYHLR